MPLVTDLDTALPLPKTARVRILWPNRYCWKLGGRRLEVIKRAFRSLPQVEIGTYDVDRSGYEWHERGGFPVSRGSKHLIGTPGFPKGAYDLRGEVFEIHHDHRVFRVAYDYSDYTAVSEEVLEQVDFYFKAVTDSPAPDRVHRIGIFANNYGLLARARRAVLTNSPDKAFDVYGRFGEGTDGQSTREHVMQALAQSDVNFTGGFNIRVHAAYLKELMRAKLALDVTGQGPWSYRLAEAMAVGSVALSTSCVGVAPERMIDGVHYVSIASDGSDVVEKCEQLLADDVWRENICIQAKAFFDRNFSPQSKVRRILRAVLKSSCDLNHRAMLGRRLSCRERY